MGSLERRVERLEEELLEQAGAGGGLEERLWRTAYRSLSTVEMHVLGELRDAYRSRPGLSPAKVWHELTEAQRAMEYRWLSAVRGAAQDLAENGEGLDESERGELREVVREVVRELGNYPFFRKAREEFEDGAGDPGAEDRGGDE